jgi:hypothetical protein
MPEVPEGSIVITPKEFYDGVRADITEIKAAVSPLPEMRNDVDALDKRVSSIERRMWIATGFAAALGTGAGSFLAQAFGG